MHPLRTASLLLTAGLVGCVDPHGTRMDALMGRKLLAQPVMDAAFEAMGVERSPPELEALPETRVVPIRHTAFFRTFDEVWQASLLVIAQRGAILEVDRSRGLLLAVLDLPFVAPPLAVRVSGSDPARIEMVWMHAYYELDAESRRRQIRRLPPLSYTFFPLEDLGRDLLDRIEVQSSAERLWPELRATAERDP